MFSLLILLQERRFLLYDYPRCCYNIRLFYQTQYYSHIVNDIQGIIALVIIFYYFPLIRVYLQCQELPDDKIVLEN